MKSLFSLFLIVILASCQSRNEPLAPEKQPQQKLLVQIENTEAFNQSFKNLIQAYLVLKDSLIAERDSGIAQSARLMIKAADSLKLDELKADTSLQFTARTYSEGIASELVGLLGEPHLIAKRRSFQMVSDQLYDLILTVQFNQILLLHAYCKNAFDDQGAYWICLPDALQNPYLSKSASNCSEIRDTIQMRVKN